MSYFSWLSSIGREVGFMQASFAAQGLLTRPRADHWASHGSLQTNHRMWLSASCIYHHINATYSSTKHRLNIYSVLKLSYLPHIASFGSECFQLSYLDEPMLLFVPAAVVSTCLRFRQTVHYCPFGLELQGNRLPYQ